MCARVCACVCARACVPVYVRVYARVCASVCMCVRVRVRVYVRALYQADHAHCNGGVAPSQDVHERLRHHAVGVGDGRTRHVRDFHEVANPRANPSPPPPPP